MTEHERNLPVEFPNFQIFGLLQEYNASFSICDLEYAGDKKAGDNCICSPGYLLHGSKCVKEALIPVSKRAKSMKSKFNLPQSGIPLCETVASCADMLMSMVENIDEQQATCMVQQQRLESMFSSLNNTYQDELQRRHAEVAQIEAWIAAMQHQNNRMVEELSRYRELVEEHGQLEAEAEAAEAARQLAAEEAERLAGDARLLRAEKSALETELAPQASRCESSLAALREGLVARGISPPA